MTVPSPYVRRHWLAQEIRRLRQDHHCSGDDLARAVKFPRNHLTWLENAHIGPDIDLVTAICDYLRVEPGRRQTIISAATDGWTEGWWEFDSPGMGRRQALHADLESGTRTIFEYALALPPGLLQTSEFADARARSDPGRQAGDFDPAKAVAARKRRQEKLLAPSGPRYELVLDAFAVERLGAEPGVVAAQLRYIVALCSTYESITVRILPVNAPIKNHSAPQSAYSIFQYRDEHDTLAVIANTLDMDIVIVDRARIGHYLDLHSRLEAAALSPDESAHLLEAAASRIERTGGMSGSRDHQLAQVEPK